MLSINSGGAIASEAKGLIATCLFINISMLKELIVPLTSRVVSLETAILGEVNKPIFAVRDRGQTLASKLKYDDEQRSLKQIICKVARISVFKTQVRLQMESSFLRPDIFRSRVNICSFRRKVILGIFFKFHFNIDDIHFMSAQTRLSCARINFTTRVPAKTN